MRKCKSCGVIVEIWAKNYSCIPVRDGHPLFPERFPDKPELSAIDRGFNRGDIVRNRYGHVAIVTFANDTWGDIRVRLGGEYANEYVSVAMAWRVLKKATQSQASKWLMRSAKSKYSLSMTDKGFTIDPITQKTIFGYEKDKYISTLSKTKDYVGISSDDLTNIIYLAMREDIWNIKQ